MRSSKAVNEELLRPPDVREVEPSGFEIGVRRGERFAKFNVLDQRLHLGVILEQVDVFRGAVERVAQNQSGSPKQANGAGPVEMPIERLEDQLCFARHS